MPENFISLLHNINFCDAVSEWRGKTVLALMRNSSRFWSLEQVMWWKTKFNTLLIFAHCKYQHTRPNLVLFLSSGRCGGCVDLMSRLCLRLKLVLMSINLIFAVLEAIGVLSCVWGNFQFFLEFEFNLKINLYFSFSIHAALITKVIGSIESAIQLAVYSPMLNVKTYWWRKVIETQIIPWTHQMAVSLGCKLFLLFTFSSLHRDGALNSMLCINWC